MHRLSCTQLVTTCMSLAALSALSFSMQMEAPRVCFIRQIGTSTGRGDTTLKIQSPLGLGTRFGWDAPGTTLPAISRLLMGCHESLWMWRGVRAPQMRCASAGFTQRRSRTPPLQISGDSGLWDQVPKYSKPALRFKQPTSFSALTLEPRRFDPKL